MTQTDSAVSPDQLLTLTLRLEALEARTAGLATSRTRWRTAAVLGLCGLSAVLAAGMAPQSSREVVRTKRLEIVGDNGVALACSATDSGGQLDVWDRDGANVARLRANGDGGDLNLWSGLGTTVFATWATPGGAELGLWDAHGTRQVGLIGGKEGGGVEVGSLDGKTVVALGQNADGSGIIQATNGEGAPYFLVAATTEHGGRVRLGTDSSRPMVELAARPTGGGVVGVANGAGTMVGAIRADQDGSGRMDIATHTGSPVFSVDAVPGAGAALTLSTADGQLAVVAAARPEGGQINLLDIDGIPIVEVGPSPDQPGGALILRNGEGAVVTECGVNNAQGGSVTVMDSEGASKTTMAPIK